MPSFNKFKMGDTVRSIAPYDSGDHLGRVGKIVITNDKSHTLYGIDFGVLFEGSHYLSNRLTYQTGYWLPERCLELITPEPDPSPPFDIQALQYDIQALQYEMWEQFLAQRGVEQPCEKCSGLGVRVYGSTATWHKDRIGGAAMTQDVCDECWGSGDAVKKWPSHAKYKQMTTFIEKG